MKRLWDRWSGLRIRAAKRDRSPIQNMDTATGDKSATYFDGWPVFFRWKQSEWVVRVNKLHLVPRLRIDGAKPPFHNVKIKVKQSRQRPGGAQKGSRKLWFSDFVITAQDGGYVVSLTHRPPLPPGNTPGTHFCQRLSRPQSHSAIGRILCQ